MKNHQFYLGACFISAVMIMTVSCRQSEAPLETKTEPVELPFTSSSAEATAAFKQGMDLLDVGNTQQARVQFTKAIELDATNPVYFDNRALSRTEKEDYNGAIEDYSSSIELYPTDPETFYQRGLVKLTMNNKYDACLDFKTAEELGSTEAKAAIKKNCK